MRSSTMSPSAKRIQLKNWLLVLLTFAISVQISVDTDEQKNVTTTMRYSLLTGLLVSSGFIAKDSANKWQRLFLLAALATTVSVVEVIKSPDHYIATALYGFALLSLQVAVFAKNVDRCKNKSSTGTYIDLIGFQNEPAWYVHADFWNEIVFSLVLFTILNSVHKDNLIVPLIAFGISIAKQVTEVLFTGKLCKRYAYGTDRELLMQCGRWYFLNALNVCLLITGFSALAQRSHYSSQHSYGRELIGIGYLLSVIDTVFRLILENSMRQRAILRLEDSNKRRTIPGTTQADEGTALAAGMRKEDNSLRVDRPLKNCLLFCCRDRNLKNRQGKLEKEADALAEPGL